MLSFLGVNRNINRGWRTLPRAFGGVGLLSFAVEQMIAWAGMLLQHFGVPSLLGRKFQASLEALQLEIGVAGNPLLEDYDTYGGLATDCWFKRVWERLDHYGFEVHLDYPTLEAPRVRDEPIMVAVMADKTLSWEEKQGINRCRLAFKMLWKSDGVTADGRRLEPDVMTAHGRPSWLSSFVFPREEPSVRNWVAWRAFWSSQLCRDGTLERPLGV